MNQRFNVRDTFGTEVWVRRTDSDWGLRDFACEAGVSPAMVSLIENDLMLPRSGVARAIADTLSVPCCERAEFLMSAIGYKRQFSREILAMHK